MHRASVMLSPGRTSLSKEAVVLDVQSMSSHSHSLPLNDFKDLSVPCWPRHRVERDGFPIQWSKEPTTLLCRSLGRIGHFGTTVKTSIPY